jgi:hypothetical protein
LNFGFGQFARTHLKGTFTLDFTTKMSIVSKLARPGPMTFVGRVTKAGVMNKTVTVTVDRIWVHPKTHKVLYSLPVAYYVEC